MKFRVMKTLSWCMGHRIPEHKGKCRSPHGHTYHLKVTFEGPLKENGMVHDFSDIKKIIKSNIYDVLDHSFMIYEQDPWLKIFATNNENWKIVVVPFIPTAEAIALWCVEKLKGWVEKQESLRIIACRIQETPSSWAEVLLEDETSSKKLLNP